MEYLIALIPFMIKAFLLGYLISSFEPLQYFLSTIKDNVKSKNAYVNYIKDSVSCHKCISTWIALYLTFDIYSAAIVAISVYIFELIMIKLR